MVFGKPPLNRRQEITLEIGYTFREVMLMSKIRNGHVLRLEDGHYYIEEAPFTTPKLDEAE
jgi:hypothetical protein